MLKRKSGRVTNARMNCGSQIIINAIINVIIISIPGINTMFVQETITGRTRGDHRSRSIGGTWQKAENVKGGG